MHFTLNRLKRKFLGRKVRDLRESRRRIQPQERQETRNWKALRSFRDTSLIHVSILKWKPRQESSLFKANSPLEQSLVRGTGALTAGAWRSEADAGWLSL